MVVWVKLGWVNRDSAVWLLFVLKATNVVEFLFWPVPIKNSFSFFQGCVYLINTTRGTSEIIPWNNI